MEPDQSEKGSSQPEGNDKRKINDFPSSFRVKRVCVDGKQNLLLIKPDLSSEVADIVYPTVSLMKESPENKYALEIMHNIHHKNILSMKVFCHNNDANTVETFVEPIDGLLWSACCVDKCADRIRHVPSSSLQGYIRQIILGLDFLMKNGLYHGNLNWDSTLYYDKTVKLAGFKSKEPMSIKEAQWGDWQCFLQMLERISYEVNLHNQSCSEDMICFCGTLDNLISMLKKLDMTWLPKIKDIVLEDIFFWNVERRVKFFGNTVSLKLSDTSFMERISKSLRRGESWNTDCTSEFKDLVVKMNGYRENQKEEKEHHKETHQKKGKEAHEDENGKPYNGACWKDYLRLICGGYTHWRQIKVDVDQCVRKNHPSICSDVMNILEGSDGEDLSKQSDEYGPQGYHSRGHGASSRRRPRSQSQRNYGYQLRGTQGHCASSQRRTHSQSQRDYQPRGTPPPENYTSSGYLQQIPPRGCRGSDHWQDRQPDSYYQSGGSDYRSQGSQPYDGQPPRYNNTFGQSQAHRYGQQQHELQQNYGHGYGFPGFGAPPLNQRYAQHGWQAPVPYAHGPPVAGYQQAGRQQGGYAHPPIYPNYRSAQQHSEYGQGAPLVYYPPNPSMNLDYGNAYLHSGNGATAPTAGQAGNASMPAAGQSSAHAPGYASAHSPAGYIHPPRHPPNYDQ